MNKEIHDRLKKATDTLQALIAPLSQQQLNEVPFENSWTAAQVAQHLLKSYNVIETLNGNVADTDRDPAEKVPVLENVFLNFTVKLNSPDFILPSEKEIEKQTLESGLKNRICQLLAAAAELDLNKLCTDFSLPNMGTLTRLEWINFVLFHTLRHNRQLEDIIRKINV